MKYVFDWIIIPLFKITAQAQVYQILIAWFIIEKILTIGLFIIYVLWYFHLPEDLADWFKNIGIPPNLFLKGYCSVKDYFKIPQLITGKIFPIWQQEI